jgi:hypothetical protein
MLMADMIAEGVGEVRRVDIDGNKGPAFVFEEYHTSRVGQLQIAVMLLRLYEKHGMRYVGLEGALQSDHHLAAEWFHSAGSETLKAVKEDVAVRMLAEGEISAAEFMTLCFRDVHVHGTEIASEYNQVPDIQGSPAAVILAGIAEKKLSQSDIRVINNLISRGKQEEALEHLYSADPWVRKQFELLKNPPTSAEAMEQQSLEILKKARSIGVEIDSETERELQESIEFLRTASKRSETMTVFTVNLTDKDKGPTAMIIGAAHSERVTEILGEHDVSFVLLRPIALNPDYANLTSEQFDRKNKALWCRTTEGTLGRLLNAQRKPQPIIETSTAESYASAYMAAEIVALASRDSKRVPDDVWDEIKDLPSLEVDRGSFKIDGFDVIFKVIVIDTDGKQREVWIRVGTATTKGRARELEEKLHQSIADLGGGGRLPPNEPPPNSEPMEDKEGPGDGVRSGTVISRIGATTLVAFAENKSKLEELGTLSG